MNDPKIFFRELDSLLARISKKSSGENFLTSIFKELDQNFGKQLHFCIGSLYEQRGQNFISIFTSGKNRWKKKIAVDSGAIQEVMAHGSFIFDNDQLSPEFGLQSEQDYIIPAALYISSPERNWLLLFGLKHGWTREQIALFLNSVQTALNYRLFSDIIHNELQQAVQIQKSLLPRRSPELEGYEVYGQSIAAELVGGDFFEYFAVEKGTFGVSIGDASGHGLPAALLVRDVVIGLRMGLAQEYKLVHTITKLNRVIQQSTYASNFVSLFIGEVEQDGHLFYVNAGHPAPFLVKGKETIDLSATGLVLGFLKDSKLYRSHVHMPENSVLVLFTDGIVERENSTEDQFGLKNLKTLVIKNSHKTAKEIVELIFSRVSKFGNSKNWEDDATVVVLKRKEINNKSTIEVKN